MSYFKPYPSQPYVNASFSISSDHNFDVINPYTKEKLLSLPFCDENVVEKAIDCAYQYQQVFQNTTAQFRSSILQDIETLLQKYEQDIAICITEENGKPLAESLAEVRYTTGYFRWYKGSCERINGKILAQDPSSSSNIIRVQKRPVGVSTMITPWNFPLAMLGRKVAMAFAAGCCVIAKPSEETPISALILAKIVDELQLPSGLFQVVFGDAEQIGNKICTDMRISKISFTGSTRVGRILQKLGSSTLKRMSLELGGNAPFIVFDDADLSASIEGTLAAKFRNCGQTCIAANRFLIHESLEEQYIQLLITEIQHLQPSDGLDPQSKLGPLINTDAKLKITSLVQDALEKGATIRYGKIEKDSNMQSPVILDNITDTMVIWKTEIFGPIVAIRSFTTEAEAIELANDTQHGLAAYFYSSNAQRQWQLPSQLQYGMVGVNTGKISTPLAPFGGIKQSGMGREGSDEGLNSYLETQYVNTNLV